MLIWLEASNAQNKMAAISADGNTVCVLTLHLNSSSCHSIAREDIPMLVDRRECLASRQACRPVCEHPVMHPAAHFNADERRRPAARPARRSQAWTECVRHLHNGAIRSEGVHRWSRYWKKMNSFAPDRSIM